MKYEYLKPIGGGFFLARETGKSLMVIDEREITFFKSVRNATMVSEHYMLVHKARKMAQLIDVRDWHVVLDKITDWQTFLSHGHSYPLESNCHLTNSDLTGLDFTSLDFTEESKWFEHPYVGYQTENGNYPGVFDANNELLINDILVAWVGIPASALAFGKISPEGLQIVRQEGKNITFPNGTSLELRDYEKLRYVSMVNHFVVGATTHNFFVFNKYLMDPPKWINKDSGEPILYNTFNNACMLVFEYNNHKILFDTAGTGREIHFDQPIKLLSSFVAQSDIHNICDGETCIFVGCDKSSFIYNATCDTVHRLSGETPTVTYM